MNALGPTRSPTITADKGYGVRTEVTEQLMLEGYGVVGPQGLGSDSDSEASGGAAPEAAPVAAGAAPSSTSSKGKARMRSSTVDGWELRIKPDGSQFWYNVVTSETSTRKPSVLHFSDERNPLREARGDNAVALAALVDAERQYVSELHTLHEYYIEPLQALATGRSNARLQQALGEPASGGGGGDSSTLAVPGADDGNELRKRSNTVTDSLRSLLSPRGRRAVPDPNDARSRARAPPTLTTKDHKVLAGRVAGLLGLHEQLLARLEVLVDFGACGSSGGTLRGSSGSRKRPRAKLTQVLPREQPVQSCSKVARKSAGETDGGDTIETVNLAVFHTYDVHLVPAIGGVYSEHAAAVGDGWEEVLLRLLRDERLASVIDRLHRQHADAEPKRLRALLRAPYLYVAALQQHLDDVVSAYRAAKAPKDKARRAQYEAELAEMRAVAARLQSERAESGASQQKLSDERAMIELERIVSNYTFGKLALPGRLLVVEGGLPMARDKGKFAARWVVLFTDALMWCKPKLLSVKEQQSLGASMRHKLASTSQQSLAALVSPRPGEAPADGGSFAERYQMFSSLKFEHIMPLARVMLLDGAATARSRAKKKKKKSSGLPEHFFQVCDSEDPKQTVFSFAVPSAIARRRWTTAIREAVDAVHSSLAGPTAAMQQQYGVAPPEVQKALLEADSSDDDDDDDDGNDEEDTTATRSSASASASSLVGVSLPKTEELQSLRREHQIKRKQSSRRARTRTRDSDMPSLGEVTAAHEQFEEASKAWGVQLDAFAQSLADTISQVAELATARQELATQLVLLEREVDESQERKRRAQALGREQSLGFLTEQIGVISAGTSSIDAGADESVPPAKPARPPPPVPATYGDVPPGGVDSESSSDEQFPKAASATVAAADDEYGLLPPPSDLTDVIDIKSSPKTAKRDDKLEGQISMLRTQMSGLPTMMLNTVRALDNTTYERQLEIERQRTSERERAEAEAAIERKKQAGGRTSQHLLDLQPTRQRSSTFSGGRRPALPIAPVMDTGLVSPRETNDGGGGASSGDGSLGGGDELHSQAIMRRRSRDEVSDEGGAMRRPSSQKRLSRPLEAKPPLQSIMSTGSDGLDMSHRSDEFGMLLASLDPRPPPAGLEEVRFARISRIDAVGVLQDRPPGSYVVRPSSQPGAYTVTFKHGKTGVVQHCLVLPGDNGGWKLEGGKYVFASLKQMLGAMPYDITV